MSDAIVPASRRNSVSRGVGSPIVLAGGTASGIVSVAADQYAGQPHQGQQGAQRDEQWVGQNQLKVVSTGGGCLEEDAPPDAA